MILNNGLYTNILECFISQVQIKLFFNTITVSSAEYTILYLFFFKYINFILFSDYINIANHLEKIIIQNWQVKIVIRWHKYCRIALTVTINDIGITESIHY